MICQGAVVSDLLELNKGTNFCCVAWPTGRSRNKRAYRVQGKNWLTKRRLIEDVVPWTAEEKYISSRMTKN